MTVWSQLIRQKRARGFLHPAEKRTLEYVRSDEQMRRLRYIQNAPFRNFLKAIRSVLQ